MLDEIIKKQVEKATVRLTKKGGLGPDIDEAIYLTRRIKALGAFLNLAGSCDYNLNENTAAVGAVIEDLANKVEAELDPDPE